MIAGVALFQGVVIVLWGGSLMHKSLHDELSERVSVIGKSAGEAVVDRVIDGDALSVNEILRELKTANENIEYVYITDFDGNMFAHSFKNGFPRDLIALTQKASASEGEMLDRYAVAASEIIHASHPLIEGMDARIHVGINNQDAIKQLSSIRYQMAGVAILAVVMSFFAGIYLSRRVTRPLSRLVALLRYYGRGVAVAPFLVDVKSGGQEVVELNVAFKEMLSERLRSEASMQRLSMALEQSGDAVTITDRDGIIEYVNPAFEKITGYSKREAVGKSHQIVNSGQHEPEFFARLWQTILSGEVFSEVFINRRKDGSHYYEEKTITPIKDATGGIRDIVSSGRDVTERLEDQEHLQYLAHHDALTALPNRALFSDRLNHALAQMREVDDNLAVLFLDLDRFKIINDTLGHGIGDEVLRVLAERLKDCVREGDTIARLGGDEFAILIQGIKTANHAAPIAQKILDSLVQPFELDDRELYITTSIGISLAPMDGDDAQSLLKHADIAMYRAKDLGRNTYQFYSQSMSDAALERLTLETDLRHALEREEFRLYYQPQVNLNSGEITGIEALLRWQHPELGLVEPVEFIPILEETGLIVQVGEWVLRSACIQAKRWQKLYESPLRVAVNLSGRQFSGHELSATLRNILHEAQLDPHLLEVEITESTVMRDDRRTMEVFNTLSELGVGIAIDDFGTGYSSLGYLKRFPIDTLKIDRSFIRDISTDPDDAAIVSAIIALADSLNLRVIAEGVETEAQNAFLCDQGCQTIQGYLFSRPMPADQLEQLLVTPPGSVSDANRVGRKTDNARIH